ncbi:hypothetical protein RFZ44_22040, partial [Acinetobacter sp. 163]|nr:hypothetical protein [Acinetobacter sp. 163]
LVDAPLMGFGGIHHSVSYFDALHTSLLQQFGVFVPPQGGIGLLAAPSGVIPEDKGMLCFGFPERIAPIFLDQRVAIVQKE